uniref:AAA+ ATPase domain-containing protein n=1 Tax=Bathycoccus sp. RCC716 virus 2 TaxID=2530039 RepID=A0A7S6SWE8_9PHYC|nr:hypothetical protein [Bathycoccus sp. RCC716 virus 2]
MQCVRPITLAYAKNPDKSKSYSSFVRGVKKNKIKEVQIYPKHNLVRYKDENGKYSSTSYISSNELWKVMESSKTEVNVMPASYSTNSIPALISIVLFGLFFRLFMSDSVKALFNKSATFNIETDITTRFSDVQGIDNARGELEEIVDFLKTPDMFLGTGARIPKGALLTGVPGTGKTLLARAISGESSVPFIQCSGSSFVELYVGLGAKRVRQMFELARKKQPCIIFIDEIDAIGKKRSMDNFSVSDEREQTINQLLTEMDGFNKDTEIVVIAATNRVDILDEALLRPGRFDRKIQVSLPDVYGREAILKVHCKDKRLEDDVSIRDIAKQTAGFTGADLENFMNECAIRSVKDTLHHTITNQIIENVYQRLVFGLKGVQFSETRKIRVAYHEAGHAIIGVLMKEYDTVRKVSILPRGSTCGITYFQPSTDDTGLYTKEYLLSRIKVALGGYAAEEIVYGKNNVTTGSSNDLEQTFTIAREMVTTYGMSETIGKMNIKPELMSYHISKCVDNEIRAIIDSCYYEVIRLLKKHRNKLDALKNILVDKEIIDGSVVYEMFALSDSQDIILKKMNNDGDKKIRAIL